MKISTKNKKIDLLILATFFALIMPVLMKLLHFSTTIKVLVFFLVYGAFSYFIGTFIKKHGLNKIFAILFPLEFVLTIFVFGIIKWSLVSALYGYFFALFFLVVTVFALLPNSQDESDKEIEKQIPIDGGIKDLENNGKN
ncbi:MAG: hypothetical protein LBM27_00725 [Lactobacillaceae bacterium]|jgi:hypothetical protein|nr:hypothetical protein [Lactobacillaceae bacterium]